MKEGLMRACHSLFFSGRFAGIAAVTVAFWSAFSSAEARAQAAAPVGNVAIQEQLGQGLSAELRAELDSYIRGAVLAFDVPGAAVAVLQDGKVAYRSAFGVRGGRRAAPVDTRTLFMVGSITKSMTSTMIATLVDDKLVAWDAPVKKLLPTFALAQPEYESGVTLRHLLSHQSGLSRSDVSLFLGPERPLELIDELSTTPMFSPPGQLYQYQNQAYSLAGFAAARATGARNTNGDLYRDYERLMQDRVFEPVGMRGTTLDFDRATRSDNHALPNEFSALSGKLDSVQIGFERFATSVAPAGAVWSNIEDMGRYATLHMNRGRNLWGRRVVSEAALEETHTPMVAADGGSYGLGWSIADSPFGRVVAHSGGTAGFGSDLVMLPERGWGIVVLTNRASSFAFVAAVERYALDVLLGRERTPDDDLLARELELRAGFAALLSVTAPVEATDVSGVLGSYGRNVTFFRRGPDLILRNEFGEMVLRKVVGFPGAFLVVGNTLAGAVALFSSDESGNVSVTLGLPTTDGGDLQLEQPVTLSKVQRPSHPRPPPRWTRDPRDEWRSAVRYLRECGVKPPAPRAFR